LSVWQDIRNHYAQQQLAAQGVLGGSNLGSSGLGSGSGLGAGLSNLGNMGSGVNGHANSGGNLTPASALAGHNHSKNMVSSGG